MTPKRWRERLLENRPNAREIRILEDGQFTKDAAIFWSAYKAGSFTELPADLSIADFGAALREIEKRYDTMYLIDDANPAFGGKFGPVAFVGVRKADAVVELEGQAFKWATPLNCLRCAVAFLHKQSWSKQVGVCLVRCNDDLKRFLDRIRKYAVLFYLGPAAEGSHLYWVRGRFGME
jgi:hypothetical protein